MFEKILFATDFSEYARKALDCIAGFPGIQEITLLHVLEEARSPRGGGEISEVLSDRERILFREEQHHLESLAKGIRVHPVVKTSSDTAGAILEAADDRHATLIVIGARGNTLIEGVLLGSVSLAILRRSRTSVLIMRHRILESIERRPLQRSCPMVLSRVLCPIDFSPHSDHAVSLLGRTPGLGEVILLTIVSHGESESEVMQGVKRAEEQLEEVRVRLLAAGIPARSLVRRGDPGSEIIRVADEEDVSVIWISSHGKGWFRELLLGSTTYTVAMNAHQPVIIIRRPDEDRPAG